MGCFPHFFQAGAQLKQSRQQILNRQSREGRFFFASVALAPKTSPPYLSPVNPRDHFQVFPLIAGKCGVGQAQRIGTDVHGFLGAVLLEPKHRSAQFKQEKEAGRTPAFR
jgi:hypothetical protein